MGRRTELQIALIVVGMITWGYGQRTGALWLQYTGIGFFGLATALRFIKRKPPE